MNFLLDTDTCIYSMKNQPPSVRKRLNMLHPGNIGISSITVAELRYGVVKSQARTKNSAALNEFLTQFEIMLFDEAAAEQYGEIRVDLEIKGTPIGPLDMQIAAHAISLDAILVTNNLREFRRVPGLKCVSWVRKPV